MKELQDQISLRLRTGGPESTTESLVELCLDEGLTVRKAYQLVGKAKADLVSALDASDRPQTMATQMQRLEHVFSGACQSGDWNSACKAIVALNDMLGLRP